ncbi:MAG: LamG domain-containing protein [Verrucomicrobiales bacterium]|nr:LamG domain-containing protein [Verrucomicrobiales bacterium]
MTPSLFRHPSLAACLCLTVSHLIAAPVMESWETGYTGADATGPQVVGYWKFDGDTPETALKDVSGRGNDLKLEGGSRLTANGKAGDAFEGFPGFPVQDKRHAAAAAHQPGLNLTGAFTLEMWISPKPEFEDRLRCFLMDKKYVDHTDFQWQIGDADKAGLRRMWVSIGFGSESRIFYSEAAKFEPGAWRHVAFTYDGAGEGRFFIDGQSAGRHHHPGVGGAVPGTKPLSIGDRLGSNYGGFPGFIDEVRIAKGILAFEPVSLTIHSSRRVWQRMETAAPVEVTCTNLRREPLSGARLHLSWSDGGASETIALPDLAPGTAHVAKLPVNTALRPGRYALKARLELTAPKPLSTSREATYEIVARMPARMPVIMWGAGGEEIPRLKDLGFTHFIGMSALASDIWAQKKPVPPGNAEYIARNRQVLDDALAHGLEVVAGVSPMNVLESDPANLRIDRQGKPYERRDICASIPAFAPFFGQVGEAVTDAYGDHPAFSMALVNTEVRDSSTPSFNPVDVANYRAFSGGDIPAEVVNRWGVDWQKLPGFPANRAIPEDHPILKYYRWFWTVGDGWNGLHSAVHGGLKVKARPGFRTFFDPAVRQPSISGAGGDVDILSHWTYTYPDPLKIGLCADQLFAMAEAGGWDQQVMKMTQLIWYRSQTAPIGAPAAAPVPWQDHDPDAAYITIAPMHLRQALWSKIARPVRGIMYHGWQSLVETDSPGAYRYTNPHTQHELKRLLAGVIEPLGPALLEIPGTRSDVVLLESFTSQMFARRGGYGSNLNWSADVWLALQHAHVGCDILYEETLLRDGLKDRKILILPECDVLTEPVVKAIAAWQAAGGKIVADEFLCPALKADVTVTSFRREKKADLDKARVLALAKELGPKLDALGLKRPVTADDPEIIVHRRRAGEADYVFAINDRREFGTYVGQHGLVMENGLPSSGHIILTDGAGRHAYDLVAGISVPIDGSGRLPVALGPCDGRLFLILPRPIGGVTIESPDAAKAGASISLTVTVTDPDGKPQPAVIPLRLDIRDANGRLAEGSGYRATVDGRLTLTLDLAPNEDPGVWEITAQELASRRSAMVSLRVEK